MKYNEVQNLMAKIIADIELVAEEVQSISSEDKLLKAKFLVESAKIEDFED